MKKLGLIIRDLFGDYQGDLDAMAAALKRLEAAGKVHPGAAEELGYYVTRLGARVEA